MTQLLTMATNIMEENKKVRLHNALQFSNKAIKQKVGEALNKNMKGIVRMFKQGPEIVEQLGKLAAIEQKKLDMDKAMWEKSEGKAEAVEIMFVENQEQDKKIVMIDIDNDTKMTQAPTTRKTCSR